jgi:hypothetical protein
MVFLTENFMFGCFLILIFTIIHSIWYTYFAKVNKFRDDELITRWIKVQDMREKYKQRTKDN